MTLQLVVAPTVEPLTAVEVRALLNLSASEVSDAVLDVLIKAARQMFDGANSSLGIALNTQTWDLTIDHFPGWNGPLETGFYGSGAGCGPGYGSSGYDLSRVRQARHGIVIPLPPLQSITSVTYFDTDGNPQTLDPATYVIEKGRPSHIVLANGASWPSVSPMPGAVTIRFVAGYGDTGNAVPQTARMAIAMQVSHLRSLFQQNLFLNREEIPGVISRGWTVGSGAGDAIGAASAALMEGLRVLGE